MTTCTEDELDVVVVEVDAEQVSTDVLLWELVECEVLVASDSSETTLVEEIVDCEIVSVEEELVVVPVVARGTRR